MKLVSEEKLVESLTVKYYGAGNQEKVAFAAKLQEHVRKGKSFEEISKLYPGSVTFSVMRFQDLQGWLKDGVKGLKAGEVSVIWKKGAYMILRPLENEPSSGMNMPGPEREKAMRTFLQGWVEELKKTKGAEIVYE
jgi:hypothetical protein